MGNSEAVQRVIRSYIPLEGVWTFGDALAMIILASLEEDHLVLAMGSAEEAVCKKLESDGFVIITDHVAQRSFAGTERIRRFFEKGF